MKWNLNILVIYLFCNDLYNIISSENSNVDLEIDLKDELKRLNPEERELILQRYFNNLTQTEVSRETGMSQVQISRKETKILQKLKQRLGDHIGILYET